MHKNNRQGWLRSKLNLFIGLGCEYPGSDHKLGLYDQLSLRGYFQLDLLQSPFLQSGFSIRNLDRRNMMLEWSILVHFLEVYLEVWFVPLKRSWLLSLSLLIHQSTNVVFQALFSLWRTKLSDPLISISLPFRALLLWWNPPRGQQPGSLPLRRKPLGKIPSGVMFCQLTGELAFTFVSSLVLGKGTRE